MLTVDIYGWLDAGWEEQKHPRGQPENKGEFAARRGGAATQHLQPAHSERTQWPEHIQALRVPPAWANVQISHDPNADLLVTGHDAKGRKQYVYNPRFANTQAAAKYARIQALAGKIPMIDLQNERNRRSPDPRIRDLADATALIMRMGVRPGSENDTGAGVKAYGATTLEGRHVVREGAQMFLRFTGKKGVSIDLPVEDASLAKMLAARARQAGPAGQLFPTVSAASMLDYIHQFNGGGFKTKDLRTYVAAQTAQRLIADMKPPANVVQYKKAVRAVAAGVAKRLGNTATVALQSYIPPVLFSEWRMAAGA